MDSDPADGRIKFYSLSKMGVQLVSEANVKMKEMNASLFQNLEDNSSFLKELKGVYQTLDERFKS